VSQLPLAICFPSGLHATDVTLKLREVNTQINRTREGVLGKKLACPSARSASTGIQQFEIFYIHFIFEHVFINNIYLFEWFVSRALEKENDS